MSTLKGFAIVAALLVGGISIAMAQNGLPTGGEHPVAGGAAGGPGYGYYHHQHLYNYYRPHHRHWRY
jgi:hypothetical protein